MIDSVVCWKWAKPGYRSSFGPETVNILRNQVARHYPEPHRFICITDDPAGIEEGIEVYPLSGEFLDLRNPTWSWGPNCYPRLFSFSKEFEQIAGQRFVNIDLDTVITGDLRPIFNRTEDFVIYASVQAKNAYTACLYMMTTGCRSKVWDLFDPRTSPQQANAAGHTGSDQGWIKYVLGPNEATWKAHDGIFAYRHDCMKLNGGKLPKNSRMVVFHGKFDPWMPDVQARSPWIREYYK